MPDHDIRGDFYNNARPLGGGAEIARSAEAGLDFEAEQSVNPEDLNGGGNPIMPQTAITAEPTAAVNSLDGLEHLMQSPTAGAPEDTQAAAAQALVYLRVSTPRQLHTAADIDEDGNSIATQRVETLRKVRELGVTVAKEFVEPGQSAQTISKRNEFKKLLRYVDDHPEVRFVVIYMLSLIHI